MSSQPQCVWLCKLWPSRCCSPCCSTGPWPAPRAPLWWSGSSREWRRTYRSSRSAWGHNTFAADLGSTSARGGLHLRLMFLLKWCCNFFFFFRAPRGVEGRHASGRAGAPRRSHPWRNACCSAAPQVASEDTSDMKTQLDCGVTAAEGSRDVATHKPSKLHLVLKIDLN